MASFPVYTAYGRLGPARLPVTAPPELSVLAAPGDGGSLTLLVGGASCGATGAWCVPADLPAQDDRGPARDLVLRLNGWPAGTVATATALALPGQSQPVALASLESAPIPAVAYGDALILTLPTLEDGGALIVDVTPAPAARAGAGRSQCERARDIPRHVG